MEQPCIFEAAVFSFFLFLKLKLETSDYPGVLSFIISSFLKTAWVRRVEPQSDRPKRSDAGADTSVWSLCILGQSPDITLTFYSSLYTWLYIAFAMETSQLSLLSSNNMEELAGKSCFSLWLWPFYWLISRLRGHMESRPSLCLSPYRPDTKMHVTAQEFS